jgi:PAS domain S-box-containing protein
MRHRLGSHHPAPPRLLAVVAAVALVGFMAIVRLDWERSTMIPIGFGVPIVVVSYFRSRAVLWGTVVAFTILICIKFFGPHASRVETEPAFGPAASAVLLELDLLLIALMGHIWISLQTTAEARNIELAKANAGLVAHEEEIARQNEELQSQAEELERQGEELRTSNEQLELRERTLNLLLSLSRSLTTELNRNELMIRICRAVGMLAEGDSVSAAAILEQDGSVLKLACHHGFGPDGPREQTLPLNQSFASLVLARGRTGYIEDISLRPDMHFPQPASGENFAAVLAVPLRVGGSSIGTLEAYSRHKTAWTEQHVMLMESLAAQTSISLEATYLFEAAREEKRRLETVLRTVPVAMVIANADCSEIRVNSAAAAMLQIPSDTNVAEELGRGNWRLFSEGRELAREQYPVIVAALGNQEVNRLECEQEMSDGTRRTLMITCRPIRDADGASLGAVGALVDITPLKELQREIDQRRVDAEDASIRKTRFLAAISHDVRTPANAISLLADLIRRTAANPALLGEIPELSQELYSSSVSLVNLLNDVLDIARFDSGRLESQISDFSLTQMLGEEGSRLAPLVRQKNLTYKWAPPPEPIWLRADRTKLSRIVGNLLGNAIKFTERGEVRLEAEKCADGSVEIRVKDTGVGIAPEHQKHIFDEFFQLRNPERDRNKGTGLGLAICKRLVDAMGAKIQVDSTPGHGSTFVVTLPATDVIEPAKIV